MFKPGSIRKIEVKNFVTYSYAELHPGPNLNMIIGPNGTGKSTMVAAIILGLGGSPKIVGRGHKISEYVKHDCEFATIHIYLQGDRENKFIQVSREFDIQEHNVWKIGGVQKTLTQLKEYVGQFNIQVDNLCQFLPQDRVQDFAKMNKQELLKQTQIALCKNDLIEKQNMLIESRSRHKELLSAVEKSTKKLEDAKEKNMRLEGRVANFKKKRKYNERMAHLDRRVAWILYENCRDKLQEVKSDKAKATEAYDKHKKAIEPMEQQIRGGKENVRKFQERNAKIAQIIRSSESQIRENNDTMENLKDSIQRIESDADAKISEIEERQKEIEANKAKLNELKNVYSEISNKVAEDEAKKRTFQSDVQKLITTKESLEDKREEIAQHKQNKSAEIRSVESEMQRLENVKGQRLQKLQRTDAHAYEATLWLRNNKHMFKGEIFEPIMLEVNVLDAKNAIYLENVIPQRDRLAFTCVEKSDMNLLIQQLRTKQNLTISVLHSGNTGQPLSSFRPDVPIEQLSKYGLYTYLFDLFTAPEPIMRYLCNTYRVHNIPIGNQKTNQMYERIPQQIRQFFSDKYKFSISVSRYTGEKSTRQQAISGDGGLSISVDVLKLEKIRGQREECRRTLGKYDENLNNLTAQVEKYNQGIDILRTKLREIGEKKHQADAVQNRIRAMANKIVEMERLKTDPDEIMNDAKVKKKKIIQKCLSLQEVIKNEFKKIATLFTKNILSNIEIDSLRKKVAFLENKINDSRQALREAEDTLNRIKEHYSEVMAEAKTVLNRAKQLSNGFTPGDDGFNEFRDIFDGLSGDLKHLKTEKEQIQSKISCLNTADDGEMDEYADREKLIDNLDTDIQRMTAELTKVVHKMDRLQGEWLTPLNVLLNEINRKFSQAYENMGCAGEICLHIGDDPRDYDSYGIAIKVTYRNDVPLQELNTTVQSGGERAVATATFMLSLQELTPVPFRCVDEINQGMDANNERRIFELLVVTTSRVNTAQYFLITPKLVPNLEFHESMMIHIVHNGPFVVQDRKWSFSKLCNPLGTQIH
ncbi:unnamed protein product [Brassicogethes aeneus]|uniref:Structural maintenance of chromosomes protein 5 n=1 Tax=Brassicogethes aeneus TaxID=1431903 RepID=A0A9P0AUN3_BRAAE|nr:unnamed protein product [Brassicogethes aeneus]